MSSKMQGVRPQIILFGDSITEQSFKNGGWASALSHDFSRKADILNRGYGGYTTRWALFLLHSIFPLLSANPPIGATIFFGANDAALPGRTSERQHVPIEEYKENLKKIVRHLKQKKLRHWDNVVDSSRNLLRRSSAAVHERILDSSVAVPMFFSTVLNFIEDCSPSMLVVLITPPPVDEEGRMEYARSLYGEKAMTQPERTNEVSGKYATLCVSLAEELGVPYVNLWSKMQEADGWQRKYLSDGLHLTPEGNAVVYKEVVQVFSRGRLSASAMPYDFPHHSEIDPENPEKSFRIQCSSIS